MGKNQPKTTLRNHKTARLAAMLFKHPNAGHRHAPINSFAHIVNRHQGFLRGGKGFHFYDRGADGFNRYCAKNTAAFFIRREVNCYLG